MGYANTPTIGYAPNKDYDLITAADVAIVDAGGYYTTDNVEAALQQIGAYMVAEDLWDRNTDDVGYEYLTPHVITDDVWLPAGQRVCIGTKPIACGNGAFFYEDGALTDSTTGVNISMSSNTNNKYIDGGYFATYGGGTGQTVVGCIFAADVAFQAKTNWVNGVSVSIGHGAAVDDPTAEQIAIYGSSSIAGTDANMKKWFLYNGTSSASTYPNAGKVFLGGDDMPTYWGDGYDTNIVFDGTDTILTSTGAIKLLGTSITDGTLSITGGAITGATGNISMWTNDSGYLTAETDPLSLHLDQTTPQQVTGGKPDFGSGITLKTDTYRYGVGNVSFYVDPVGGNDSNDGSIGSPFLTLVYAVAQAVKYQTYASISIRLMPGTHDLPTPINITGLQTKLSFTPSNYVSSATINYTGAGGGATVMKFTDCPYDVTISTLTIVGKYTAIASDNSNLFIGDLILNNFTRSGVYAYNKSNVYINGDITGTSTSAAARTIEFDDSTVNWASGDLIMNTAIGYVISNKSNVVLGCTQTYTADGTAGQYGAWIEDSTVEMSNDMTFDGNGVADYGMYIGPGSVISMPTYARTRAFTGFQTYDVYLLANARIYNPIAGTWTYSGVVDVYASQGSSIYSPDQMDTTIVWEELTASDYIGYDDRYLFWDRTGTTITTHTANDDVLLDGFLSMNKIADASGPGDYSASRVIEFKTSIWSGGAATDELLYLQGLPSDYFTEAEPGLGIQFSGNLRFILSVDGMQYIPDLLGGDSYTFGALATGTGTGCDVTIKGGDAPAFGNEDGGDIILDPGVGVGTGDPGDVIIGTGVAGVDYSLIFNGETNDGIVTWMEDENYFDFADTVKFSGGTKSSDGSDGATGSFTSADGKTITVKDGLITAIV